MTDPFLSSSGASGSPRKKKLLVVELWGLGDLVMATTFLRAVVEQFDVHLLAKPHAAALLARTYPALHFVELDAPWTAFRGKYRLWRWPWRRLFSVVRLLRKERFDLAVSARRDPRDHLLMRLAGATRRIGFGHRFSRWLLSDDLETETTTAPRHRVEDWRTINAASGLSPESEPYLAAGDDGSPRSDKPMVVLHTGARIAVRRWPEAYFAATLDDMRRHFSFDLILVPDSDGYGLRLASRARETREHLTIEELTDLLATADLLVCNDSGPMHIAAALGTPTISFFGPTDARVFAPWGANHKIVQRDICPYRPCFDYCHFAEPFCLTKLTPVEVWSELKDRLLTWIAAGVLPTHMSDQGSKGADEA